MKTTIKDFRGLADFEAETDGILLVSGDNGAGKTSVCRAIAAAACGDMLPFDGVTKGSANLIVRDGAQAASCIVYQSDTAGARAIWPECVRQTKGDWRDSSRVAVGLEKPRLWKAEDRAAWLFTLLDAKPTTEALLAHLKEAGIDKDNADRAVELVETSGYDAAEAKAKEAATKAKGRWEKITAERYGFKKGPTWRPKEWRAILEKISIEDLENDIAGTAAKLQELENKRVGSSFNKAAALERLKELPSLITERDRMLVCKEDDIQKQMTAHAARKALGDEPTEFGGMECPCCGARLRKAQNSLIEVGVDADPEATRRLVAAIKTADFDVQTYDRRVRENDSALGRLADRIAALQADEKMLETAPGADTELEAKIADQAQIVAELRRGLNMKNAAAAALAEHEAAMTLSVVANALAPDGLRQKVLTEKLDGFNKQMADLCAGANWPAVSINGDMAMFFGGRPVGLISAGQEFRVDCILQIAAATIENAGMVVIDGADILDRAGRNGLFGMLSSGSPSVVGMTILRRQDMPDLKAAGLGLSVWVQDGSISQEKVAA